MRPYVIASGARTGRVTIPGSKSQLHRLLICGALTDLQTNREPSENCRKKTGENTSPERVFFYRGESDDVCATKACLRALLKESASEISASGAFLSETSAPASSDAPASSAAPLHMDCGASGSTLRFLLPICGALGKTAVFHREGSLASRPMAPLDRQLRAHGMEIRQDGGDLYCSGTLCPGTFTLPGNVSSQYISGLLMALPLLDGDSELLLEGGLQSAAYVDMTIETLAMSGIRVVTQRGDTSRGSFCSDRAQVPLRWMIPGGQRYRLAEDCRVNGDWSNAAAFLCMGALSKSGIRVDGLALDTQGDRAILHILERMGADVKIFAQDKVFSLQELNHQSSPHSDLHRPDADGHMIFSQDQISGCSASLPSSEISVLVKAPVDGCLRGIELDAGPVPDLVPVVSALAMFCQGPTHICNCARLRLKESDRLETSAALIRTLGGSAEVVEDQLLISAAADVSRSGVLCMGSENEKMPGLQRIVKTSGDHRIAMAAAVAACGCARSVMIDDEQCTRKSYPDFWVDFGGLFVEQKWDGTESAYEDKLTTHSR